MTTARKPRRASAKTAAAASRTAKATSDAAERLAAEPEWVPVGAPAKLAFIQAAMEDVDKTGHNTHQNFKYFQEHGIFGLLKPFQRKLRVAIVPSLDRHEQDGSQTVVGGTITLIDTEQPPFLAGPTPNPLYKVEGWFPNEATDKVGWGTAKALTYWHKFALQKFFHIPTEAMPEQEAEGVESTPATSGRKKITKKEAAQLRDAAMSSGIDTQKVLGQLKGIHGVDKTDDLTQEQAKAFSAWLVENTKGSS